MRSYRDLLFVVLIGFSIPAYADDLCENNLEVIYHERIPYVVNANGTLEGLTATPAVAAFDKSNIKVDWKQTPVKRQLKIIKNNSKCICSIGWFKNPEREKFARYSTPIYQDKPQVAITSANNRGLTSGETLAKVLKNFRLTLLIKDGYSYGKFIDENIEKYKPTTHKVVYGNLKMLSLIYHQRYDYFFIAPEEVDTLVNTSEFKLKDFKVIKFKDMPEGEKRYILCSMKVPEKTILKLNANIAN